jgi:phospholipase/carboxylesterase
VQTVPDTDLIQFENWTLRIRTATDPTHAPRFLLLIHGWTGDENSMWVFTRDLPSHYWMMAPRAPYTTQPSGYSWREGQSELIGSPTFDMFAPAAEALIKLVDAYSLSAGREADASVFDVIGFSQGAVMSSLLAFLYPHRIHKTGILAGFIPAGLDGLVAKRPLEGKPFFVTHGTKDETVTIDRARASIEILERAGARVTYCEDEVGHKVSLPCLRALREFLAE